MQQFSITCSLLIIMHITNFNIKFYLYKSNNDFKKYTKINIPNYPTLLHTLSINIIYININI